jgi:hypothetical protein
MHTSIMKTSGYVGFTTYHLCLQLHHHMLNDACLQSNCYVSTVFMLQHEAEEACEVEWENNNGLTQPQCARLEQFEGFVRAMVGEGHIVNFITTLQSLSKADQRRLAKELEASGRQLLSLYQCCQTLPLHSLMLSGSRCLCCKLCRTTCINQSAAAHLCFTQSFWGLW